MLLRLPRRRKRSEIFAGKILMDGRPIAGIVNAGIGDALPRLRIGESLGHRDLLADAELGNDGFVALGIVFLEVVEQATPLADQHEQAAARAVVLLVQLEVVCQLANAFTDNGDLHLGTAGVGRVRLVLVDDRFLLLSG